MTSAVRESVAENLRRFERLESTAALTPAAVAIVLLTRGRTVAIPMFQRTHNMSRHAGQMALPGGKVHDGETVEACAIREVSEELGLTLDGSDVLGTLDDFDTRSGFTITPVVAWSGATVESIQPSKFEVARMFIVSSDELREAAAAASSGPAPGFSLRFSSVEVFAPTAAILFQFSEVALDGRSCRVADFYQPPWTHR